MSICHGRAPHHRRCTFNTFLMAFRFSLFNLPMEDNNFLPKSQFAAAPPPSPIPTAKGSRSAADPALSEYVDKSLQIPELRLPHRGNRFKPVEIDYELIVLREEDSVRRLLRSVREFGVVQIRNHGIITDELRSALSNNDKIFGLTVECCAGSYGDHDKIVWGGDDCRIAEEATAAIGEHNYQIFRQKVEKIARQLEAIARELAKVVAQNGGNQTEDPIQLGESTLSIYRYHRANIIDRYSSVIEETNQDSSPYALSIHLLLDPSELCIESSWGNLSIDSNPDTIVATIGAELEEWNGKELKSGQGKFMLRPFVHSSRPSFSMEQKWSFSNLQIVVGGSDKIISLSDQILILLLIDLIYKSFSYIFS